MFWPDLGSSRIAAITPSEGFALDRQPSADADVFRVTLNPGSVVTFVAELASPQAAAGLSVGARTPTRTRSTPTRCSAAS